MTTTLKEDGVALTLSNDTLDNPHFVELTVSSMDADITGIISIDNLASALAGFQEMRRYSKERDV